jgi:predicted RNA methylase
MRASLHLIEALENDRSLEDPQRLCKRVDALDRLEHQFPDDGGDMPGIDEQVRGRITAIRSKLESINSRLYEDVRHAIQRGLGADALWHWARMSDANAIARGDSYDCLDELVSGVLQFDRPDEAIAELPTEMVFYQPTPARHVFDLLQRAALTESDVLIDLGSGLGHVPLLAAICTPARGVGIESEKAYVACARRTADKLKLGRATFARQDARTADLSRGTLFYLYTPFTGSVMRAVLDALRQQATLRTIRVATYGPCTSTIAEECWLEVQEPMDAERVCLFHSRA